MRKVGPRRTLMMAAMVMVMPQPIAFAIGMIAAEAPAAKRYRTTAWKTNQR